MRFGKYLISFGALALGACAGGEKNPADTTAVTVDTSAATSATTPATTTPTTSTGTLAPITGTTHEVKMIGDTKGYRFEPANVTVKQGDGIKFVNVIGGPHNVAFDAATIPADAKGQLDANFGADRQSELSSKLTAPTPGGSITISFANIKPGSYPYYCLPHRAMNMTGTITVQ